MMKDLLERIEEIMPSLSKQQKAVGSYITEHYDKAAYMTATKLAKSTGVSESTVVRFSFSLGYNGYPALQAALKDITKTRLTTLQRIEITNDRIGNSDILSSVLNSDIDKIKATLEGIDRKAFDMAINSLINARDIYIAGARTSSILVTFLGLNLNMIFDNVHPIQSYGGNELIEQLMRLKSGDVLIAITFPRYSKRIVDAVRFATREGATVIGLTDSESSPIAESSNILLTAKSDMESFTDSLVAPLSILNALIVALSAKKKEAINENFERLEKIWSEFNYYEKNNKD